MAAYDSKEWSRCGQLMEEAGDAYNAACCYALSGDADRAFTQLGLETAGLISPDQLNADGDLSSLHTDSRWPGMLTTFAEHAAALRASMNGELRELSERDQADRQGPEIDWGAVKLRDLARRRRVRELLDTAGAKVSADFFHAALIFQHGETAADAQLAHDLALRAIELDPKNDGARSLAAAALDRRLMYENKPQRFGTQFVKDEKTGAWGLWPVDPSVADEERGQWNVPTLEAARQQAARMNQLPR